MNKGINQKKLIYTSIIVNAIQILIIGFMLVNTQLNGRLKVSKIQSEDIVLILYIVIITLIINSVFTFRHVNQFLRNNVNYNMIIESNNQLIKLNNTLRFQRHDYINHLQVVYSLMEMEEYKEAQEYIGKVCNDIHKINKVLRTNNAAVNALLQAKLINAEKENIDMEINIKTKLTNLNMPSWEFCRVLGNIIDNGIYELKKKDRDKILVVNLYESNKDYGFKIINNGPKIHADIINDIFKAGFTTKGNRGEGMGLAITKQLITKYNGTILVQSLDSITEFQGTIPKKSFRLSSL